MKRSNRRWDTFKISKRRVKEALQCNYIHCTHGSSFNRCSECQQRIKQLEHRSRNLSPFDCGNPKCQICHLCKVQKIKSYKQKLTELRMKNQIKDFFED